MLNRLNIPLRILSELELSSKQYGLNTPQRIAHFVSQARHESQGFTRLVENLNYSAEGLLNVFPKYFADLLTAKAYERQPEKIANRVYANRNGNGDETSADGWKSRGRGIFMLTGRYNYNACGIYFGEDFINNPNLLQTEEWAVKTALWYWVKNGLNDIADMGITDDVVKKITLKINGGYKHLSERIELFKTNYALMMTE